MRYDSSKGRMVSEIEYFWKKNRGLKNRVLTAFYKTYANSDSDLARLFGVDKKYIQWLLNKHLDEKFKRINKRKFEDIDWGGL